ncbi:MAG: hypothetical protein A2293_06240 [Elusimicrobia bacterium RIFOXYB2_FULL_49_7]|nr:MAG: hypothetical protein A2293_06240 [Elusimicrobia bacterium RIFOXYB2_FULL_49_7]
MPSQNSELLHQIQTLIQQDGRYRTNAYLFVLSGLDFTLEQLQRRNETDPDKRHVTGRELSLGIRDYALREFGPSAKMVLEHWGLLTTRDFGHIVYSLIGIGLMGKNDKDSLEDFNDVFDFEEEFIRNFRFRLADFRNN